MMARIRTIKPEFWTDEKLAPMSSLTRLTFLGLLSMADDAGRLVDSVKHLDGLLFSESEDSCRDSLDELERAGVVIRGTASNGRRVIQIAKWSRHQKVDHPNEKACLPEIKTLSRTSRELLANDNDLIPDSLANDSGDSPEQLATRPTTDDQRATTNDHLPTTDDDHRRRQVAFFLKCPDGQVIEWTRQEVELLNQGYPSLNIEQEARRAMAKAASSGKATPDRFKSYLHNWLGAEANQSSRRHKKSETRIDVSTVVEAGK